MKNTVTLVGLVGNTPDVRTIQSGTSITTISLATIRNSRTATATACPRLDGTGLANVARIGVYPLQKSAQSAINALRFSSKLVRR